LNGKAERGPSTAQDDSLLESSCFPQEDKSVSGRRPGGWPITPE
jgi:hypothetical protein